MNANMLFYNKPAEYWMDALPLGNGSLGAMCYSGTHIDRMILNHDTLWTGFPNPAEKPDAYDAYQKAQNLAREGKYAEAQAELEKNFLCCWSQAYMTFGEIVLHFNMEEAENYERKLDLSKAVLSSRFEVDTNKIRKTAFISYPHNVLVYQIESDNSVPFSFEAELSCPLRSEVYSSDNVLIADGECPGDSDRNSKVYPCNSLIYYDEDAKRGIRFRGALKTETNGTLISKEKSILVQNATKATLYFAINTSYNGFDKLPVLEGKEYKVSCLKTLENAAVVGFDALMKAHVYDYCKYYDRVSLHLDKEELPLVATEERLESFMPESKDMALYELLFNFGRYLLIASSREGSQATNLQGIWNNSIKPAWNSNYTININTEMNYWPVLMCGMPELMAPLIELIQKIAVTGKKTAKEFYHANGFAAHHNSDIWGYSVPALNSASWGFWSGGSGWLCRSVYELYEYTQDKEYLENTAFPLLKEAAAFYLDILVKDADGRYMISPATSPENIFAYGQNEAAVSESTAMMNCIALDLFINCKKSCEELKLYDDFYSKICEVIDNMQSLLIGENGAILEWNKPFEETEVHHRHVSHLYALHPAHIITPKDTSLFEACKKTLEIRGDDGTGWSLAWKINFWARLRDGDHALRLVDRLLTLVPSWSSEAENYHGGGGLYPNMFDAHPPFQIDGNFGAVSGICEMLLQADGEDIYLLPALPTKWKSGSVRGLAAPGNITVDMDWNDNKLVKYTIHGDASNIHVIDCTCAS